jgi:hypothetical protein
VRRTEKTDDISSQCRDWEYYHHQKSISIALMILVVRMIRRNSVKAEDEVLTSGLQL